MIDFIKNKYTQYKHNKLKKEKELKIKEEKELQERIKHIKWYRTAKICNNCISMLEKQKMERKYCMGDSWMGYTSYYYCLNENNTKDKLLLSNEYCTCEHFKQKPKIAV